MNEKLINKILIFSVIFCMLGLSLYYNWDSISQYFELDEPEVNVPEELQNVPEELQNASDEGLIVSVISKAILNLTLYFVYWTIGTFMVVGFLRILGFGGHYESTQSDDDEDDEEDEEDEELNHECEYCDQEYDIEDSNAKASLDFCSKTCEKKTNE